MIKKIQSKKVYPILIVYLIVLLMGMLLFIFPTFGFYEPVVCASTFMYAIAFFGLIAHFYSRSSTKEDYEMLIFSLLNVVSATYLLLSRFANISNTLGTGFLIYTLLITFNRLFKVNKYKKENSPFIILKLLVTIAILFLGILTIINLYNEVTIAQTLIIGFYFLIFGLLTFIESLITLLIDEKKFEGLLNGEKKEKSKKVKKYKNENIEQLDKIVSEIEVPKKSKRKSKISKKNK